MNPDTIEQTVDTLIRLGLRPGLLVLVRGSKHYDHIKAMSTGSVAVDPGRLAYAMRDSWAETMAEIQRRYEGMDEWADADFAEIKEMSSSKQKQVESRAWARSVLRAASRHGEIAGLLQSTLPDMFERSTDLGLTPAPARAHVHGIMLRAPVLRRVLERSGKDLSVITNEIPGPKGRTPTKVSLSGEHINIALDDLAEELDRRKEHYTWDGITTQIYTKNGEHRVHVIFWDKS